MLRHQSGPGYQMMRVAAEDSQLSMAFFRESGESEAVAFTVASVLRAYPIKGPSGLAYIVASPGIELDAIYAIEYPASQGLRLSNGRGAESIKGQDIS